MNSSHTFRLISDSLSNLLCKLLNHRCRFSSWQILHLLFTCLRGLGQETSMFGTRTCSRQLVSTVVFFRQEYLLHGAGSRYLRRYHVKGPHKRSILSCWTTLKGTEQISGLHNAPLTMDEFYVRCITNLSAQHAHCCRQPSQHASSLVSFLTKTLLEGGDCMSMNVVSRPPSLCSNAVICCCNSSSRASSNVSPSSRILLSQKLAASSLKPCRLSSESSIFPARLNVFDVKPRSLSSIKLRFVPPTAARSSQ